MADEAMPFYGLKGRDGVGAYYDKEENPAENGWGTI